MLYSEEDWGAFVDRTGFEIPELKLSFALGAPKIREGESGTLILLKDWPRSLVKDLVSAWLDYGTCKAEMTLDNLGGSADISGYLGSERFTRFEVEWFED